MSGALQGRHLGKPQVRFRSYLGHSMAASPPLPPIYMWGRGRLEHTTSTVSRVWSPPPQFTPSVIFSWCLGEALHGSNHHHRHHAVVLTELIYSFDPLLDRELEGRHHVEHVQNSEVSCVRYSIGGNEKTFDYINHVK